MLLCCPGLTVRMSATASARLYWDKCSENTTPVLHQTTVRTTTDDAELPRVHFPSRNSSAYLIRKSTYILVYLLLTLFSGAFESPYQYTKHSHIKCDSMIYGIKQERHRKTYEPRLKIIWLLLWVAFVSVMTTTSAT